MSRRLPIFLLACLAAVSCVAADVRETIETLARPLVESETVVGMVVGVVDDGRTTVVGLGRRADGDTRPPDGETLFEIGSISKVFTGLLLADAVVHKQVALDDPVAKYLPSDVKVPSRDDRPIRLVDLATHTSALPRLPDNLLPQIVANPDNPYAKYSVADLHEFLNGHKLSGMPGKNFAYSNLGMGLLGQALARQFGKEYEELLIKRVADPLAMADTRITLSPAQQKRLCPGHTIEAMPTANWDIPTLAGAGAIRATADDMLAFLATQLAPAQTPLAAAIKLAQQPQFEISKGESIALGWLMKTGEGIWWHNGQTGGYHSIVLFQPATRRGVVVLSNTAGEVTDLLAFRLLKALAGAKVEPFQVRMPKALTAAELDRYVGDYSGLTGSFHLTRDGDRLLAQLVGQPATRIFPASETKFFYRAVAAEITFELTADGKANKLVLHQHGVSLPFWRGGLIGPAVKRLLKSRANVDKQVQ